MIMTTNRTFIVGLALLCGACAIPQHAGMCPAFTLDGFHGRWWNYYERGNDSLSGAKYNEAEADFQQALKTRSNDTWRARTYGLHFVEYFPNRELGVCCFQKGRLDEAEKYLAKSLTQVDTVRARYYLDEIKKARIANGELKADTPPVIKTAETQMLIATREVPIAANVNDTAGVAQVMINGVEVPQRGSAVQLNLNEKLLLSEGNHAIQIVATNLGNKPAETTVQVNVDLTGPNLGIFSPVDALVTEADSVHVKGVAVDQNGMASLSIGGEPAEDIKGLTRKEFERDLPLKAGENTFDIAAKDRAGNETRTSLKVFKGKADSPQARLWRMQQQTPERLQWAMTRGAEFLPSLLSAATDSGSEPVSINVRYPVAGRPYHHNKTLRVVGEVLTATKVTQIAINNQPFEPVTGAPKEVFNRAIPIDAQTVSTVAVNIQAKDDKGHEAAKHLDVAVEPVLLDSIESKMPIAVLAFHGTGIAAETANALRDLTEGALLDAKRFHVLERQELQAILTEQQLAAALSSPEQAIPLGKVIPAYAFLVAEVSAKDKNGLEVSARVFNAEGTLLTHLDMFIDDKGKAEKVKAGCKNLAAQMMKAFPRLTGELVGINGDTMVINWTREDGALEDRPMMVLQESSTDTLLGATQDFSIAATGKILEFDRNIGMAKAKKTQGQDNVKVDKGMPAITM